MILICLQLIVFFDAKYNRLIFLFLVPSYHLMILVLLGLVDVIMGIWQGICPQNKNKYRIVVPWNRTQLC